VHRHIQLHRVGGDAALEPLQRGPRHAPALTAPEVENEIVWWRKHLSEAGFDAGALVRDSVPSLSTIHRVLRRRGLVIDQPQKRPRSSLVRFAADLPNECWQTDMTHWHAGGEKVEILHFIDDCSRVALSSKVVAVATAADATDWTVVIIVVVIAIAAVAITAIVTFGSNPVKTTSVSTTTTHSPAATSTTTLPASSTTTTSATTTQPSTAAVQTITYGSPNGVVVWQTGDAIPGTGGNAYEGYYCCNEPFPDGMNRSGSAGCSGQGTTPNIVGGYYADGQLC
jgi:hypothetical protein